MPNSSDGPEILDGFFEKSLAAVEYRFTKFFPGKSTRAITVYNDSWMREQKRKFNSIEFPIFVLQMQSVVTNPNGLPAKNLFRTGWIGGFTAEKTSRVELHPIPTLTTMRVRYVTQKSTELYSFIQYWLMTKQNHKLDFIIADDNDSFNIPIRLEVSDNIQVPPLTSADDSEGDIFIVDTTVDVSTYVMEYQDIPVVKTVTTTNAFINGSILADENGNIGQVYKISAIDAYSESVSNGIVP